MQITLCQEIQPSIFFLPSNRLFIWPGFELGHRVTLPDIVVPEVHDPVSILTISVKPRIFVVDNLISNRESDFLIQYVSNKSSEEDGLDVSLVGDAVLSSVRTSYNGWDSESTVGSILFLRSSDVCRLLLTS